MVISTYDRDYEYETILKSEKAAEQLERTAEEEIEKVSLQITKAIDAVQEAREARAKHKQLVLIDKEEKAKDPEVYHECAVHRELYKASEKRPKGHPHVPKASAENQV